MDHQKDIGTLQTTNIVWANLFKIEAPISLQTYKIV